MALSMARSHAEPPLLLAEPGSRASRGSRGLRLASHEAHVARSKGRSHAEPPLLASLEPGSRASRGSRGRWRWRES